MGGSVDKGSHAAGWRCVQNSHLLYSKCTGPSGTLPMLLKLELCGSATMASTAKGHAPKSFVESGSVDRRIMSMTSHEATCW